MTDQEIFEQMKQMTEEERPGLELWNRIEERLDAEDRIPFAEKNSGAKIFAKEEDMKMEEKKTEKKKWFDKLTGFFAGGGTMKIAAALCCVCIICFAAIRVGSLGSYSGKSSYYSSDYDSSYNTSAASGTALSAASKQVTADYEEAAYAEEYADDADYGVNGAEVAETPQTGSSVDTNATTGDRIKRKLIRTIDMRVETKAFDDFIAEIQDKVKAVGGYVESSGIYGNSYGYSKRRSAELTLRIPAAQTDALLAEMGETVNIVSKNESVQDITRSYMDIQSHIKALETEQERLLDIMEKAETVEELMSIEDRLANVRYELDYYRSVQKGYDDQVDYDTITLSVSEVTEMTPTAEPTLGERIVSGLVSNTADVIEGLQEMLIWAITGIPYFILLFLVIAVFVKIIKLAAGAIRRKKDKK